MANKDFRAKVQTTPDTHASIQPVVLGSRKWDWNYGLHKALGIGILTGTIMLGSPIATGMALAASFYFFNKEEKGNQDVRKELPVTTENDLPKESRALFSKIRKWAKEQNLQEVPVLHLINDKTEVNGDLEAFKKHANAAAVGLYDKHDIIVSEELLEALTPDEEGEVVAHEFVHIARHHLEKQLVLTGIVRTALLVCTYNLLTNIFSSGDINALAAEHLAGKMPKLEALTIWSSMKIGSKLLLSNFARDEEFEADNGAAELDKKPYALASALKKIRRKEYELAGVDAKDEPVIDIAEAALSKFQSHPGIETRRSSLFKRYLKNLKTLGRN